ncbi:MAG: class I SAM-dependent methyltransferase [Saprospiraceae bacterium]|nr:class I SAM-dependent methyltransferase [Lewinellaceae bacterium]
MQIRIYLLVAVCGICRLADAQSLSDEQLINGLNAVRSEALRKNAGALHALNGLLERWDSLQVAPAVQQGFLVSAWYAGSVQSCSEAFIHRKSDKTYGKGTMPLMVGDLAILGRNKEMAELLVEGFLTRRYPFPIDPGSAIFSEFLQYGLHDSIRIGEIGAGSGIISLVIGASYQHLEIYVNELEPKLVGYIEEKLRQTGCIRPSNHMAVVQGEKSSTKLEGKNLDLILIRDSFHHFGKKEKMLDSIAKSLHPDGRVVVVEPVLEAVSPDSIHCSKLMKKPDILKIFRKQGFVLQTETEIGGVHIFTFQKSR